MTAKSKIPERTEISESELSLSALLSHVLVGFTIEFDNEFERRTPHSTTRFGTAGFGRAGAAGGPWLASLAMYSNFLRLVPDEGISIRELQRHARLTKIASAGMERWRYVTISPVPANKRAKVPQSDWTVRPTSKGRSARETWAVLFDEIERRWQERFGSDAIERLREALVAVVEQFDLDLPEFMPVLGYGLTTQVFEAKKDRDSTSSSLHTRTLPALLSKALVAFALKFERESAVSLAMYADALRVFDAEPIKVRDLPRLAGVSKEAIAIATAFLRARGLASIEADPTATRGKVVRLTQKGKAAAQSCALRLKEIEDRWRSDFGSDAIGNLRDALQALTNAEEDGEPLLLRGLRPAPENWRASLPQIQTLPHFPMVLHRGGFPDGS